MERERRDEEEKSGRGLSSWQDGEEGNGEGFRLADLEYDLEKNLRVFRLIETTRTSCGNKSRALSEIEIVPSAAVGDEREGEEVERGRLGRGVTRRQQDRVHGGFLQSSPESLACLHSVVPGLATKQPFRRHFVSFYPGRSKFWTRSSSLVSWSSDVFALGPYGC